MKILFLTKYDRCGASSRYRFFQYYERLEKAGFTCHTAELFNQNYVTHLYQGSFLKYLDALQSFFKRLLILIKLKNFDILIIEKEIFPYFPAIFESFIKNLDIPIIVDYDDALFHQYDCHQLRIIRHILGSKIASVMRCADLVTVGNSYLAEYALKVGAPWVEILPTTIDLEKYKSIKKHTKAKTVKIAWIGTPKTEHYLQEINLALESVALRYPIELHVIGGRSTSIPSVTVNICPWTEATEVSELLECDIGIMPLPNEPWEWGKCGLKLIQYMACGLPVIASPVGVNTEIVIHGVTGFLASTHEEWFCTLKTLIEDTELRIQMGEAGRQRVEQYYCLQVTAPKFVHLLELVLANHQRRY